MSEINNPTTHLPAAVSVADAAASAKRCPKCKLIVEETDNYCRYCGRSLKSGRGFLNSHVGIILLMLLAGPFALPWVWTSKRISSVSKIIYTLLMLIIGYYLIITCVQIYQITLETMQNMQSMTIGF